MRDSLRPAIVMIALMTLLTGLVYPVLVTLIVGVAFPEAAGGSLIRRNGKVVGSALLGQTFASDEYFHGRPSAAGSAGYDASASSGSNLGPTSKALVDRTGSSARQWKDKTGVETIPVDLVTASASGLDPHISPASAELQVAGVARARGISADHVRALVAQASEGRLLGLIGEPRVNVLQLNLALDDATAPAK